MAFLTDRLILGAIGVAFVGMVSGVLLLRKQAKESHYKHSVKEEAVSFNECIQRAKTEQEVSRCGALK